jgi:UDP:flavonoid glycosyltransferase YjiC (YdhE family)
MLALGLEFKRRGHQVSVASTEFYRPKVESLGLEFCGLRPHWDPTDQQLIAQCEDLRSGPEVLFRNLILPHLRDTYDDLLSHAARADILIAGELVYAAPLVAEKLGRLWASAILSPTSFFSAHDPSLLVNIPEAYALRRAGWLVNRALLEFGKLATRSWWKPVRQLRREAGLRVACDPVFRDKFSPHLVLALFSRCLAEPQPDWPKRTIQPGFAFFDQPGSGPDGGGKSDPQLQDFLDAGDAPIIFTLGSTAVNHPGNFYPASLEAARRLGRRALLIGAAPGIGSGMSSNGPGIMTAPYADYSRVFPHAAAIVHQGGSGTTGQALRAGKPQLIVPFGWDQPDNGERVARLGAGLCLARKQYSSERATTIMARLLEDEAIRARALEAAAQIRRENAITEACDAVESIAR